MPDIAKCKGINCPIRDSCYRYTSEASYMQTYISDELYDHERKYCQMYWRNK